MWQAHSWRAFTFRAGPRKLGSSHQGLVGIVGRFLISFMYLVASGSYASERLANLHLGPDAIYNQPSIQSRVLGGGDAEVGAWPSMAAIVTAGMFPLEERFFCGGTVISERWILTAAHCLYDPFGVETQPADIRVVVGINDLRDDTATELVVTGIYRHPQFDAGVGTLQNDLALLELANVVSVPATALFDGDLEAYNDTLGFITGWGATDSNQFSGSEIYPNLLQDASVPLVSLERCNSAESYQGGILDTQVCAGFRQGGVDSCVGDSGGPLFIIQGGEQVQVGITSFGNGCGLPNFYGIYTNISAYSGWISDYVDIDNSSSSNTALLMGSTGPSASTGISAGDVVNTNNGGIEVDSTPSAGSLNFSILNLLLGLVYVRFRKFSLQP